MNRLGFVYSNSKMALLKFVWKKFKVYGKFFWAQGGVNGFDPSCIQKIYTKKVYKNVYKKCIQKM